MSVSNRFKHGEVSINELLEYVRTLEAANKRLHTQVDEVYAKLWTADQQVHELSTQLKQAKLDASVSEVERIHALCKLKQAVDQIRYAQECHQMAVQRLIGRTE